MHQVFSESSQVVHFRPFLSVAKSTYIYPAEAERICYPANDVVFKIQESVNYPKKQLEDAIVPTHNILPNAIDSILLLCLDPASSPDHQASQLNPRPSS